MSRPFPLSTLATLLILGFVLSAFAQMPAATSSTVPALVNFNGVLTDLNGEPLKDIVGATFSLYRESQGGAPLWLETQSVQPDKAGHYSVVLGSTKNTGLPNDLFVSGEARWLGVQVQGQPEQPRVLLLAVPYALKARDAETIGGLSPSAFMLAAQPTSPLAAVLTSGATGTSLAPPANVTGSGTLNFLPLWKGTTVIGDSILFQSGSGPTAKVGINTITPFATLDVGGSTTVRGILNLPPTGTATVSSGFRSQAQNLAASAFKSGGAALNQSFRWQAEPMGNNTVTPSATLNLLFGANSTPPVETGLKIAGNGLFTFAAGQTFPGTGPGTVTSVGLAAPASDFTISGSPVKNSGTLNFAWNIAPTSAATPNAIIKRDASGNFAVAGIMGTASSFAASNTTQVLSVTQGGSGAAIMASSATNNGIVGQTSGVGHQSGVLGIGGASGTFSIGVQGQALSTTGTGVVGVSTGSSGIGVTGRAAGASGIGVSAVATSATGSTLAVFARASSPSGVAGVFDNAGGGQILSLRNSGVQKVAVQNNGIVQIGTTVQGGMLNAVSSSPSLYGLYVNGFNAPNSSQLQGNIALYALGGTGDQASDNSNGGPGVVATGGNSFLGSVGGPGIDGTGGNADAGGVGGSFVGGLGRNGDGDGIDATNPDGGTFGSGGFAGNFKGDINVSGAVFAGTKDFKIDHPLDPANKYLLHTSVESSEMKNIYDGNVTTDSQGDATVQLPEWFEALNTDFRYQLTVIGQFAQVIIARKIENNRFQIRTSVPNVDVSWQVTGVRQDAYAKANPLVVEQEKEARLRGYYIHPELYGVPPEKQIEWVRNPEGMRRIKEMHARRQSQIGAAATPVMAQ